MYLFTWDGSEVDCILNKNKRNINDQAYHILPDKCKCSINDKD